MKFVFASDSFKGSLSSIDAARLLTRAAREFFPESVCVSIPVADGGEGTAEALYAAKGGVWREARVHDPLMRKTVARWLLLPDGSAVMEMAAASGLTLLKEEERDPLRTSSFGTGELLRAILGAGVKKIAVGIGGSATNDGGTGFLAALGARFSDKKGDPLSGRGANLEKIARIDLSLFDPRVKEAQITVMSDVKNPLCGENGATLVYGRQKGASGADLARLEAGMENWRGVLLREGFPDPDLLPGAGAAGGMGAALALFCGGAMRSGAETVLDLAGFDEALRGADLVVTGEGRADAQSACGKVVSVVGVRAKKAGVPAAALCGTVSEGAEALADCGIAAILTTAPPGMPLREAMANAEALYLEAARRLFRRLRDKAS